MEEALADFDICDRLPEPGVTVLEASAGTGKTFTIAALVARMVAEGLAPLSKILVVTFTRMATGELRERVRERLVSVEAGLGEYLEHGRAPSPSDTVLALLCKGGAGEVIQRRQRVGDALSSYDTATITTTHGFCFTVLGALGAWGEVAPGTELLEDTSDLVQEVVDDLLVRHALRAQGLPFRRRAALQAASHAVNNPGTELDPAALRSDHTPEGVRRRLAEGARKEVGRRLVENNLLTYDDLLVRLARALADPQRGAAACRRLRQRFSVVLVDEFQDTDGVQWQTVKTAFADGTTRLVLIGDPKQAIYSFRGADVYAYLQAARTAGAGRRFTLGRNWRSSPALLEAFDALLEPLHLGHPEIVYRRPQVAEQIRGCGLEAVPGSEPLRFRFVGRESSGVARTQSGLLQKDAAVRFVAQDLAFDIAELLQSAPVLSSRPASAQPGPPLAARLGAGDVGVLVRTNKQALVVRDALRAAGVPVVVAGAQSVLATRAARHWLDLLEALEQPASRGAAAAVALGPFVGMSAAALARADERAWEELHARLHDWSSLIRRGGVAALFWHITASERLPARLLRHTDGERQLTDLAHIAELLYAEAIGPQLGLAALKTWLARRCDEVSAEGTEAGQRSRRLDSDAEAVQVMTVHRAKGLEFPVVYCPYLWDAGWRDRLGEPVVFHDSFSEERRLDVGGDAGSPVYNSHYQLSQAERRGEDIRHLYVALTRAKHQVVIWWAGARDCQHSALGRLLLARNNEGDVKPSGRPSEPKDSQVEAELAKLVLKAHRLITVQHCVARGARAARRDRLSGGPPAPQLGTARFERDLDLDWRRSSYTSITASAHVDGQASERGPSQLISSEPEQPGKTDEPASALSPPPVVVPAGLARAEGLPSAFAGLPLGAEVGTFVHAVLERMDFTAPDLGAAALEVAGSGDPPPAGVELEILAAALEAAIRTPFGSVLPGLSLRDFGRADRLDELYFELPVAGGDNPRGQVPVSSLAALLGGHMPAPHPLSGYPAKLAGLEVGTGLKGYLTGSLDLVLRHKANVAPRYFVVDYKTNWLGGPGEALTTWHYRPSMLAAAMSAAHYPLQATFYLVALHRYLRWRQRGYDPSTHLGGVIYLFLRGMAGPGTPSVDGQTCGVFSWCPPPELVTEVSDLLAAPAGPQL